MKTKKKYTKKLAILKPNTEISNSKISKLEPFVNPLPYIENFETKEFYLKKNNLEFLNNNLSNFDCFLNLCDGSEDDDRPGIEVVQFLEHHRLPFTGANSNFYDPSRKEMKHAAKKCQVHVPSSLFVYTIEELKKFSLKFPCIVKHPKSYSSIGITKKSIVFCLNELNEQVSLCIQNFGGALIEEFIEGREFTVLVVSVDNKNAIAFDAAEIIFPEGETFKHFELKWYKHNSMKYVRVFSESLNQYLKEKSVEVYKQMNGNGYARFDYRMNTKGDIYFLELNPNCSVYYPTDNSSSADEILHFYPDGHKIFTKYILDFAMQRFM